MRKPAAALALSLLAGCSTVRQRDMAIYSSLAVADAATTYIGIDQGLREANPLLRLSGTEAWQVAASSLVVSSAVLWAMDRHERKAGHDHKAWTVLNLTRAFVVAWNLEQIYGD